MVKRIVYSLMVGILLLCCAGCAEPAQEPIRVMPEQELITAVTDPEELAAIAERDGITAPEGYHLEKVAIYPDYAVQPSNPKTVWPYTILYRVGDCHSGGFSFYDASNVVNSDWFDGPCEASVEVVGTENAWVDAQTRSAQTAVAAHEEPAVFSITVPEGKKVNIRTYTQYSVLRFDVVNRLTEQTVEEDVWMARPDGRVFIQYTFGV